MKPAVSAGRVPWQTAQRNNLPKAPPTQSRGAFAMKGNIYFPPVPLPPPLQTAAGAIVTSIEVVKGAANPAKEAMAPTSLETALESLAAAENELRETAARRTACGDLTPEDVIHTRMLLKRAIRVRRPRIGDPEVPTILHAVRAIRAAVAQWAESPALPVNDPTTEPDPPLPPPEPPADFSLLASSATRSGTSLRDNHLETLARDQQVLQALRGGRSAREALQSLEMLEGLTRAETAALIRRTQRLRKRFQERGTIKDGRWDRRAARRAMTPTAERIAMALWCRFRGATVSAIHRKLKETIEKEAAELRAQGEPFDDTVPAYRTLARFFQSLDPALHVMRRSGIEAWDREVRPLLDHVPATRAGQIVYLDHTQVDIYVRTVQNGQQSVARPWLTAAIDCYTGVIVGLIVSLMHPDEWTTALIMRIAILPKTDPRWSVMGIPDSVVPDHGKDFMAHAVALRLRALGVHLDPCREHFPDGKAAIERFFRSLNEGLLCILPGYTVAEGVTHESAMKRRQTLLTLPQLRQEIMTWVIDQFNQRRLDRTGRVAIELWQETARIRMPESVEELDLLLLTSPKIRTVGRKGVRFTPKRGFRSVYWNDELIHHWKRQVRIAYNPDDLSSVILLDVVSGKRICEAWPRDRIDRASFLQRRRQHRAGLVERMKTYVAEVEAEDRSREEADAWDRARAETAKLVASPPPEPVLPAQVVEDPGVLDLLQRARRPGLRQPQTDEQAMPANSAVDTHAREER